MKVDSLNQLVWYRLKHNRLAFFSGCYILLAFLIAVLAALISPDRSPNANEMHLELAVQKPFETVSFLEIPKKEISNESFFKKIFIGRESKVKRFPIQSFRVLKDGIEYWSYSSQKKQTYIGQYKIREVIFYFGTDKYGRDLLSRILHGIRISLAVGFIAVSISLLIGITLGLIAGYFRGKVDDLIMWFVNVIWSIPSLLMVIAITLALGKGFWQVFLAVGLTMWVEVARVVRGEVLLIRELEFIEAGKALAYKPFRIIFKHILPNVIGPVIVISSANFAAAILIEAGLSFLGVGAQPPTASLGGVIKEHYAYIIMNKEYLAIIPGLVIVSLVLAFVLLGNGLRDAFDVKN